MSLLQNLIRTASAATVLAAATMAHAVPFSVGTASFSPGSGYGIDLSESSGTLLDVRFSTAGFVAQNFPLAAAGDFFSFTFGTINLQEPNAQSGINANELDNLGVTATFGFTSPLGTTESVTAVGTATAGSVSDAAADYTLAWTPVQVGFGTNGLFQIDLAGLTFSGAGAQNAVATVTLLRAPETRIDPVAVPEPATLALLGAGLFGVAALRRRRSPR